MQNLLHTCFFNVHQTKGFNDMVVELTATVANEKQLVQSHTKTVAGLSRDKARMASRLADDAEDEEMMRRSVHQLKETVAVLSSEKQSLLKQKSGEPHSHAEEVKVLRQALDLAQKTTESALTQVRSEKNEIILEAEDLSEQLAASQAQVASLTSQLESAERAMVALLADKEELEGEVRFLQGENQELSGLKPQQDEPRLGIVGNYVSRTGSRGRYDSIRPNTYS